LQGGAADVMTHKWFVDVDWQVILEKKVQAPIVPECSGPGDTRNFEAYPEILSIEHDAISTQPFDHYFSGRVSVGCSFSRVLRFLIIYLFKESMKT
jgi:hypothetical protein